VRRGTRREGTVTDMMFLKIAERTTHKMQEHRQNGHHRQQQQQQQQRRLILISLAGGRHTGKRRVSG